jgi:hypothetical protein
VNGGASQTTDIKVTLDAESVAVTGPLTDAQLTTQALAKESTLGSVKTAVEVLTVATPDTASGDLASMSADLGTIQADIATVKADIALMKADLASVACKTYKGADRTTTTGAAEEITIPAGALIVQLFCGVGCEAHIQLDADATTDSPSVEAPFPIPAIALGDVTKLSIWCVSGKMTAWFFGA